MLNNVVTWAFSVPLSLKLAGVIKIMLSTAKIQPQWYEKLGYSNCSFTRHLRIVLPIATPRKFYSALSNRFLGSCCVNKILTQRLIYFRQFAVLYRSTTKFKQALPEG